MLSSHLWGGGHIAFGADPAGISVSIGLGVRFGIHITFSCLHNILGTSGWVLTKFLWIYNWDITKNWLDFGDLDLIFKVTAVEKLKIHFGGTSVFSENTVTNFLLSTVVFMISYSNECSRRTYLQSTYKGWNYIVQRRMQRLVRLLIWKWFDNRSRLNSSNLFYVWYYYFLNQSSKEITSSYFPCLYSTCT